MEFIWKEMIWFGILKRFILIREKWMICIFVIGKIVVGRDEYLM